LSTALSDWAKPIPKIVARASEVFPYGNLGCTRHSRSKLRSALVGTRFLSRETTLCVCKDSKYFVHHKIPTLYSVKKFTQVHGSFI
ncbi:hypothetical protein, partial [Paramuribaculum intestinale]|uniref:hypothetical protein n=1 Tax=Paramuribaculum intestinale TaxID=2094151 RepID=UPI001F417392